MMVRSDYFWGYTVQYRYINAHQPPLGWTISIMLSVALPVNIANDGLVHANDMIATIYISLS